MDKIGILNNGTQAKTQRWLITGATGFVGREFVHHLLRQGVESKSITVVVRSGQARSSRQKFINSLSDIADEQKLADIRVVDGDIAAKYFGLDRECWRKLTFSTHIVHMAALTRFDADIISARRNNVEGVRNIIELATAAKQNAVLQHWSHISTAYVVGSRTDKVQAGELDYGGTFRNAYEQTKNEAEQLLQPLIREFPLTIFRPSIIVGRSDNGVAGNCNTVYWAIRNYLSGQTKVYANADTPLDLIPVDYVVSAIYKLIANPESKGKTIVLAGGDKTTVTLYEFAEYICEYLDSPLPELVDPVKLKRMRLLMSLAKLSKRHRQFIQQAQSYLPYFSQNPRFDTSETEKLLRHSKLSVPYLHEYIDTMLDYCLQKSWGRRSKIVGQGYRVKRLSNG